MVGQVVVSRAAWWSELMVLQSCAGTVRTLAFANLSQAYAPGHTGPTLDYSRQALSLDDDARKQVGSFDS